MFSLICVWINSWINNREAGDLKRHRCHYDVSVMSSWDFCVRLLWGEYFIDLKKNGLGNGLVPSGNKPFLSQFRPRCMSPYGVTSPQYLNQFPVEFCRKLYQADYDIVQDTPRFGEDVCMMASLNALLAFVRGIHRSPVIPSTKASDAELWCFLWFSSE